MVTGAQIRDAMRAISDPHGEPVNAGEKGFARALQLIAAGKPIDYQGASGPCHYDAHGDVVAQLVRFQVRGGRFADAEPRRESRIQCARRTARRQREIGPVTMPCSGRPRQIYYLG